MTPFPVENPAVCQPAFFSVRVTLLPAWSPSGKTKRTAVAPGPAGEQPSPASARE